MGATSFLRAALAVLSSTLIGCANLPQANEAMLTYETLPEGAVIHEGSQSLGMAPVTRTYKSDGKSNIVHTPDVTAVWPSGARASYFTVLPIGADRVATIQRPEKAPGLQVDLDNAKKLSAGKDRDAQRAKEAMARDIARASVRCKEQMAKGNLATNDC